MTDSREDKARQLDPDERPPTCGVCKAPMPWCKCEEEAHPCAIECQRHVHKGYPKCSDANQCDYEVKP